MQNAFRSCLRACRILPLVAFLAIAASCATARGADAAGEQGIQVQVENDLIPSLTVLISAAAEGTTPVRLGSLVAGAEQTFTYRPVVSTGTFRLIAERPGPSGSLVSEPIPLPDGSGMTVTWQLRNNNVIIR